MNSELPTIEEFRKVAHAMVDRRLWVEQLLFRVQAVIRARGHNRMRELRQLELAIRMEMDDTRVTKPLYDFIWDTTERFRLRILSMHDGVSDSDLFICSCIHLGLSISDVAEIRNVATSSVNMSRYRLKKKLGLQGHEDLVLYIQNFMEKD